MTDACRWYVPSMSDRGVSYEVLRTEDGTYSCDCMDFIIRKHECKHINAVRNNPYSYGREVLNKREPKTITLTITLNTGLKVSILAPEGSYITRVVTEEMG